MVIYPMHIIISKEQVIRTGNHCSSPFMIHEKNGFIHTGNCFKGRKGGFDKEKVVKTIGEEQRDTWIDNMGRVHN